MKSEERFSSRVEQYVRHRPGYPAGVLEILRAKASLGRDSIVADIGSGTGISSEMLLRAGCSVIGVEPNGPMREAAEHLLSAYPRFKSVDGSAAQTALADRSIDLILAAQAFHWFATPETRAESDRILKPGGFIVLLWNVRQLDTTPFLRDYEKLLVRFGTDYSQVRHENIGTEKLSGFFHGPYSIDRLPNSQRCDYPALEGRLLSSSYPPAPGHPDHEEMLAELRRIFDRYQENGTVSIDYLTEIYVGR